MNLVSTTLERKCLNDQKRRLSEVWCQSVQKRRRSFGTNKRTPNTNYSMMHVICFFYTPLQKKRNTWFRGPHDPSLGSANPRGQKVITSGRFTMGTPKFYLLKLWTIGTLVWAIIQGHAQLLTSVAFLLEGSVYTLRRRLSLKVTHIGPYQYCLN